VWSLRIWRQRKNTIPNRRNFIIICSNLTYQCDLYAFEDKGKILYRNVGISLPFVLTSHISVISTHLKRKTRHYPETSGFDYSCGNGSLSYPLPFISALTHSFVPFENHFTVFFFKVGISMKRGTRWPIWLWNALQVGRSRVRFPDGVTGIFHLHNPSGRTMALELTQSLTEMSTRNISCGGGVVKAAGA
jgi:hypothetical protein